MKIAFSKVSNNEEIKTSFENGADAFFLSGRLKKSGGLLKFEGAVNYKLALQCDLCAENFTFEGGEKLDVYFSDGVYRQDRQDDFKEVIEFYDGFIDFDELISSEIQTVKTDYHKCEKCKNNTKG